MGQKSFVLPHYPACLRIDPRKMPEFVSIKSKKAPTPEEVSRGAMVAGARGGEPISDKMQEKVTPGETLILTPEGVLIVRRQTDDARKFKQRSVKDDAPAKVDPKKPEPMPIIKVPVVRKGSRKKPIPKKGVPLD